MDLQAMQAAVRRRVGLPSTDALGASADLTELINEALHAISTERDWPWLETSESISLSAGAGTDALPSNWVRTRSMTIGTYGSLTYMDAGRLDDAYPDSGVTGRPRYYAVRGDTLLFRPFTDAAYTVSHVYYRSETDLSANGDTPLMPSWAHTAIVEWAAALYMLRTRDEDRARYFQERADDWLRRLQDNARRVTAPSVPRVRSGSWI